MASNEIIMFILVIITCLLCMYIAFRKGESFTSAEHFSPSGIPSGIPSVGEPSANISVGCQQTCTQQLSAAQLNPQQSTAICNAICKTQSNFQQDIGNCAFIVPSPQEVRDAFSKCVATSSDVNTIKSCLTQSQAGSDGPTCRDLCNNYYSHTQNEFLTKNFGPRFGGMSNMWCSKVCSNLADQFNNSCRNQ